MKSRPKDADIKKKPLARWILICIFSVMLHMALLPVPLWAETIRVGYFTAPPFIFVDEQTGVLKGASVEFLEKVIAPQMGVEVIWFPKALTVPRLLNLLENHELDAAAYLAFRQERLGILIYPNHSYFESRPVLVFLKDHPIRQIKTIDDIVGLKIGYHPKSFLSPLMRDNRLHFEFVPTSDTIFKNFQKLLDKRIDAMYQPEVPTLLYYVKLLNIENNIKFLLLPEENIKFFTPFSRKSKGNLAERYDLAFEKVGGKDTFLKLLSEYVDVNGP